MKDFERLASLLLSSQKQAHVFHLQTTSYAEHMALGAYYEGIDALTDAIIEEWQGMNDIISSYTTFKLVSYTDKKSVIEYFEELNKNIEKLRKGVDASSIQNQIDNVVTLINSTLYKIKHLA
jgi:hypothetical protein